MDGFWITPAGDYYQGDQVSHLDVAVPERPGASYAWQNGAWINAPTAADILADKLKAGIAITSTGTPAINGTYALDPGTQTDLSNIAGTVALLNAFPGGGATFAYPDINSQPKTFPSVAVFKTFYAAYSTLVFQLNQQAAIAQGGGTPAWPSQSVTIA